jgi:hypothetical protein
MEEFEEFKEFEEFEEFEEFKEFKEFKKPAVSTTRTLKADFVFRVAGSPVLEKIIKSPVSILLELLELLELLRVVILARRLLSGCRQFWSIAWVPWVRFKMGVFQSPDLRIAEAKDVIDL